MAIRVIGENKNIFQATKGAKIAPAKQLDLREYNKKFAAKVKKREEFEKISNEMRATGLPPSYQSILDRDMEALDKLVDDGLSTDSKKYRGILLGIQNDALKANQDVTKFGTTVEAYQKDPDNFKSLIEGESGNPQYSNPEDGILNQYSYYNEASKEGVTMDQAIGGSQRRSAENLVFSPGVDAKKLGESAKQFFDANMEQNFEVKKSALGEVFKTEDLKRLRGEARNETKLGFWNANREAFREMALENGIDPSDTTAMLEMVDSILPKEESKFGVGSLDSDLDKSLKRAKLAALRAGLEDTDKQYAIIELRDGGLQAMKDFYGATMPTSINLEFLNQLYGKGGSGAMLPDLKTMQIGNVTGTPQAINYLIDKNGEVKIIVYGNRPVSEVKGSTKEGHKETIIKTNNFEQGVDETWVINALGRDFYERLRNTAIKARDRNKPNKPAKLTDEEIDAKYGTGN